MQRDDIKMLVKKWWDVYNDDSLNYSKPVLVAAVMTEPNAHTLNYVSTPSAA